MSSAADSATQPPSPAVRKLATEHSVDLSQVRPTGRDGRLLKEDILAYIESSKCGVQRESGTVLATPAVRSIAREEGINLREVGGTGENGRVLKEDVMSFIRSKQGVSVLKAGVFVVHTLSVHLLFWHCRILTLTQWSHYVSCTSHTCTASHGWPCSGSNHPHQRFQVHYGQDNDCFRSEFMFSILLILK